MNILYLLPIFISLSLSSACADTAALGLPSFKKVNEMLWKEKKVYLAFLNAELLKKENSEISKIINIKSKKIYFCAQSIYGKTQKVKNPRKCKQDLNHASAFFLEDSNKGTWERLRIKLALFCMGNNTCSSFNKSHAKILNKLIKNRGRVLR